MIRFRSGLRRIGAVRIEVCSPGDTQALTFRDVTLKLFIRAVGPVTQANDCEINARVLYLLPVDISLPNANVDSLSSGARW